MKKSSIPLSKKAQHDLWVSRGYEHGPILIFTYAVILIGCTFVLGACGVLLWAVNIALWIKILATLAGFAALIAVPIGMYSHIKRTSKKARKTNEEDYALACKATAALEWLKGERFWFNKALPAGIAQDMTALKAVRIEYVPQGVLEGEFLGTIHGTWGFLTFRGQTSGTISGETTPDLTDQNMLLICVTPEGKSIRLICPSTRLLKRRLGRYFEAIAKEYEEGSYTYEAVWALWNEPDGLANVLDRLNPQWVYDYLVTKLEESLESRPAISVQGTMLKEGTFLVASIACEGMNPQVVIPLDVLSEVRLILERELQKELPAIALS